MSILEHVNKRIECARCVAADVVQTCVEGLGVCSLPLRHIFGNLERLFEGGNLYPAGLSVRHVITSLVLVVTILLFPEVANASTLVGSYDIPTDADNVACDWFGYDYNTMDSGLKALLHSSTTTGGAGTDTNPNFAGYAAFRNSLFSPTVAGDYQWYSTYDGFMFVDAADKARADVEGAIRWWNEYGSDSGSGSGDVSISSSMVLSPNFGQAILGDNYTWVDADAITVTYNISTAAMSTLQSYLQLHPYYFVATYVGKNTGYGGFNKIYLSDTPIEYSKESNGTYYNNGKTVDCYRVTVTSATGLYAVSANTNGYETGTSYIRTTVNTYGSLPSYTNSSMSIDSYAYCMHSTIADSGGGSGGGGGGGPVPEPEPTVPAPDEKPTYDTNINVNGSINIDNSTSGTTEFELDISELLDILKKINDNLVAFAEDFHNMWDWWAEEMGVIESDMRKFQDVITTWLQMIYNKISSGASSQPNPVTEPTSWWDWLLGLLNGVIGDLPTQLSAITSAASALRNVFPFSIPWDLGVLLGLFVASPVTPVIDIPLGISASRLTYVHVDCSSWNGVMQTVRSIELVAFAAGLAFKTRELLKVVEV